MFSQEVHILANLSLQVRIQGNKEDHSRREIPQWLYRETEVVEEEVEAMTLLLV